MFDKLYKDPKATPLKRTESINITFEDPLKAVDITPQELNNMFKEFLFGQEGDCFENGGGI
jgi:hypothetical protein